MAYITLTVTQDVLDQVKRTGNQGQRQIAIRKASPELDSLIKKARRGNLIRICVNGIFDLRFGDPAAIWPVHQEPGSQSDDFTRLYDLLAHRPGQDVRFTWDVAAQDAESTSAKELQEAIGKLTAAIYELSGVGNTIVTLSQSVLEFNETLRTARQTDQQSSLPGRS